MAIVYIGLGTNLGNKEQNLQIAIQETEKQIGCIIVQSAFYITEPWGFASDNTFLNAVIEVQTNLLPKDVLVRTQAIEKNIGRLAKSVDKAYKDRIIDIDLLLYDNIILQYEGLILPHPLMTERIFVMEPLNEIAPDYIHPVYNQSIHFLYKNLKNSSSF